MITHNQCRYTTTIEYYPGVTCQNEYDMGYVSEYEYMYIYNIYVFKICIDLPFTNRYIILYIYIYIIYII